MIYNNIHGLRPLCTAVAAAIQCVLPCRIWGCREESALNAVASPSPQVDIVYFSNTWSMEAAEQEGAQQQAGRTQQQQQQQDVGGSTGNAKSSTSIPLHFVSPQAWAYDRCFRWVVLDGIMATSQSSSSGTLLHCVQC
jgi:hypothetical protein